MSTRIQNFDELNTSPLRGTALAMMDAAYAAIDTDSVLRTQVTCDGEILKVGAKEYELKKYTRVRIMGFGKASCAAAETLESILKERLSGGIVIDVRPGTCEIVATHEGTHPHASAHNVALTGTLVEMASSCTETDLVIVIVSGGGSALLCWPLTECDQSARLYEDLLKTGATIQEMNTVRKHLSEVKGGGLAKLLHPAEVVGLIFCDVPGDHAEDVASGPTYLDRSTTEDAQAILDRYALSGYELTETPKDPGIFSRVYNHIVVSNTDALDAMERTARERGFRVVRAGSALYQGPRDLIELMYAKLDAKTAVIGGGETSITVTSKGKKGGRCQYVALQALERVHDGELFAAFASDGIDNTDAAGAIADTAVRARAEQHGLSMAERLADYDTYAFMDESKALIFTGKTDANVSDLFLLLRA